jgi:hypothetical protein
MSRFSPAERARIFAESRRILTEESEPPAPEPVREVPLPEPEDALAVWKRQGEAIERERAAAKTALRAEERATERACSTAWWSAIEAHIDQRIAAALLEREHELVELARGITAFANATEAKLAELEKLLTRHAELRSLEDRGTIIDVPSPLIRKERVN